jgi:hypothetical protein
MRSSTVNTPGPYGESETCRRVPSGHMFAATAPTRAGRPFAIAPCKQYAVEVTLVAEDEGDDDEPDAEDDGADENRDEVVHERDAFCCVGR